MPQPSRPRFLTDAAGTAVSIGVGMIPLHRLPRPVRIGYVVLPAAVTSGAILLALRRAVPRSAEVGRRGEDDDEPSSRTRRRTVPGWAMALALGGAAAGSAAVSIRLDRGIEDLLRRRGVPAPRVMMGLASGALMLATNVLEHRASAADDAPSLEHRVLELLTEADPMELTPGQPEGTPPDEYRPEAESIATILRAEGAITDVQLDEVWQRWFSEPLTSSLGPQHITALIEALNALTSPTAE